MTIRIPRSPVAVWKAIRVFGTQQKLALALGVSQQTVGDWGSGQRPVPAERCPEIEQHTRALAKTRRDPSLVVTCEELRPDVKWEVLRTAEALL